MCGWLSAVSGEKVGAPFTQTQIVIPRRHLVDEAAAVSRSAHMETKQCMAVFFTHLYVHSDENTIDIVECPRFD